MAKKIIIKEKGSRGGCAWLIGILVIAALVFYAFVFALFVAVGIGLWFLVRAWWRALLVEKPDSKVVSIGMKMTSTGRKFAASVLCVVVVCALGGVVVACSGGSKAENSETTANNTETEASAANSGAAENETDSDIAQDVASSPQSRVDAFINAFNSSSETPYVQDVTFDPSDKDSPYRPSRYNSPVYSDGKGSHGTCGSFGVEVIGCRTSTEIYAISSEVNYQAVGDFARAAIYAAKSDVDKEAVEAAIDNFINGDLHTFDFMSIDSSFDGSANGKEFFLRFK